MSLPSANVIHSSWRCPECTKNIARDNRADTPIRVRGQHSASPSQVDSQDVECYLPQSNPIEQIPSALICSLERLSEELCSVRKELQLFREDMSELRSSLDKCTERMNTLEGRVTALECVEKQTILSSDASVIDTIAELRQELNERDQELLINDIEITNCPESIGENPIHLVGQIAVKLGVPLEERDIVSAARVGAHRVNATSAVEADRRPRPLVVRLARRYLRDELLRGARVRRGATTEGLVTSALPQSFYVNERLTKHKRLLFRKARETARRSGWKFVWTKQGTILVRKEHDDPCYVIRTESDIQRYFATETEKPC